MAQKPGQIYSDAPDKTNLTVGHTKTLELNEIWCYQASFGIFVVSLYFSNLTTGSIMPWTNLQLFAACKLSFKQFQHLGYSHIMECRHSIDTSLSCCVRVLFLSMCCEPAIGWHNIIHHAVMPIRCCDDLTIGCHVSPKVALSFVGICIPFNTWFLGPTQVSTRNGISIGSAIFAGLVNVFNRATKRAIDQPRYSVCSNRPLCYMQCSLIIAYKYNSL